MLRWVILVVAVVFLTLAAALLPQYLPDPDAATKTPAAAPTGPQPQVEFDQELIYDFGNMAQHDQGTHSWRIKNTGEADLEVWLIGKPTCSCTIAKLEHNQKAVVKPGDSTTIDLEWNTKDFHDDRYAQGATFGTNDLRRQTFKLSVTGKVQPAVVIYPPEAIQFPVLSNEESHYARIALFSPGRPKTKVTKVTTSKPDRIVTTKRPMKPDEAKNFKVEAGYIVDVEIKPGMPQGQFLDELVIQTDHPKKPEVRVAIGGKMSGAISVVPEGLRMHNVTGRDGKTGELALLVRGGKEAHIQVLSKPGLLEVSVEPDDRPGIKGRYRLKIAVPPGTPAGPIGGEIVLETDHPHARELKIPVDILVSRSGPG